MDLGISGKVAMVAAASKGIGLACAKALAAEGCHVSICARNEETLELAAAEISEETRSYIADVSDPEDLKWWVDQTRQDLGPIDILVTNTGGPAAGALGQVGEDEWRSGIDSTLMSAVRLVELVSPEMRGRRWGRIVHITSRAAKEPMDVLPISSTLRAGLLALTRLQANQAARDGVTVNAVLPGHTLTDRQRHLAEVRAERESIDPEQALAKQGEEMPIGRLLRPDEIAAAVAFLCSEPASGVTGVSLLVDGGQTRGLS
jgi:3-oxoacyl-[acyl-carrier protein] reductase